MTSPMRWDQRLKIGGCSFSESVYKNRTEKGIMMKRIFGAIIVGLVFTACFAIGAGLCGHALPAAWAVEPELSRFQGPDSDIDWERSGPDVFRPNAFQIEFFKRLEIFDRAYFLWQTKKQANAEGWENLATRVFGEYERMTPEGENGPFILRGKLIAGECLLFAAVDHMKRNRKNEALENYRKGLHLLQKVILLENTYRVLSNTALNELPHYRQQEVVLSYQEKKVIHPYAGYETIGTGARVAQHAKGLEISCIASGENYSTVDVLQDELRKDLEFFQNFAQTKERLMPRGISRPQSIKLYHQKSTTDTARDLLSDFCPWGLEMFFLMEQAGLTKGLDFRILRPFAGIVPTTGEKFIAGLKQIPDLIMGRPLDPQDEIPPVISEQVLRPPQIPKHIHDEMHLIIGDRKNGFLDTLRKRPIKWAWVEKEPAYTLWYVSPTVFDWQASDYLWLWFTALRMSLNPVDVVIDEVLAGLLNSITAFGEEYGETDIYCILNISVEANDKGFLTTDAFKKGEWLSSASVMRKLAGFAFHAAEDQMKQDLYEGIDPRKFSLGSTYNGGPIPPIMIRADVCGFEQVPDDKYPRTVQAVRFYLLYPENIAHKGPYQGYDLSDQHLGGLSPLYRGTEYLAEQNRSRADEVVHEPVRKLAWNRLPDPLAAFDVVNDFSPMRQELTFRLAEKASRAIANYYDGVDAELWTAGAGENVRYAGTTIKPGQKTFSLELYHKDVPGAGAAFEGIIAPPIMSGGSIPAGYIERHQQEIEKRRKASGTGMFRIALVDVKNRYQLKLTLNGKAISRTYDVNLDRGRKGQRNITGKVSWPNSGVLALEYSPHLEILELNVKKGKGVISGGIQGRTARPGQSR
ncbi:MAG: hypothetical protein JXL20_00370 [Deltaproteobacteria bacterium]|nr:hypothetical protein [Deltaproteobacteria bacterium]